jgi:tetratricopeptide (TPR) repeat protein
MTVCRLHRLIAVLFACALLLGAPDRGRAQDADPAALDSALAAVDELRQAGEFQPALERIDSLRTAHGDRADLLWRASFTEVDLAKTFDDKDQRKPRYESALALADSALAVDSTSARAHLAKAVAEGRLALDAGTQERVRRSRAVKRHADRAIALDSTLAGAYHVRARWNREVSDLNFFERAVVKTVYGGLPTSSFEQSVRDFKRAIELENVRFHHLELARTYLKMDREDDARAELQKVLDLPPKEPFAAQYKKEAEELLDDLG